MTKNNKIVLIGSIVYGGLGVIPYVMFGSASLIFLGIFFLSLIGYFICREYIAGVESKCSNSISQKFRMLAAGVGWPFFVSFVIFFLNFLLVGPGPVGGPKPEFWMVLQYVAGGVYALIYLWPLGLVVALAGLVMLHYLLMKAYPFTIPSES